MTSFTIAHIAGGGNCERILQWVCKVAEFWFVNFLYLEEFLLYHIDLQLTLMQSHLKGLMLSTRR